MSQTNGTINLYASFTHFFNSFDEDSFQHIAESLYTRNGVLKKDPGGKQDKQFQLLPRLHSFVVF